MVDTYIVNNNTILLLLLKKKEEEEKLLFSFLNPRSLPPLKKN
jgi:hypothetical protein